MVEFREVPVPRDEFDEFEEMATPNASQRIQAAAAAKEMRKEFEKTEELSAKLFD